MSTANDPPITPPNKDSGVTAKPVRSGGLSTDDLINLNEEIAGMARAGLPLDAGLAAMAREMGPGRLRSVTAALVEDLRLGHTLPEALERQGSRVPPFYAGLVNAGIRIGRINEVLATLTLYARTIADVRSTILGALFYPAIVLLIALGLFLFLFWFVVPQYEQIYHDFRLQLPMATQAVLTLGQHPVRYLLVPFVGMILGVILVKLTLTRTPWGRRAWARFVYALPIAGTLLRSARLAAFADLLGILVDYGVPLPEAFRLAGAASSDPLTADASREVAGALREGRPLAEVLRTFRVVPQFISWMAAVGERRGNLGPTLHQAAEVYRRQVEMRAALLRSVLPPVLIIILAVLLIVLFLVCLGLPLFTLLNGILGL